MPVRIVLILAALAACATAHAQLAPAPIARAPVLQVSGAEQPVRLASLMVDVEVAGGAVETRVRMVFFNPNGRILEGKLQFPLAPGQIVSGFALDVDGRMRTAVPVDKARAQQVFEDISRRRVDPGLLQTTTGNNYELRIYPLLPGKTRTVELTIVESASGLLRIPLGYADRVAAFDLALRLPSATAAPEFASASTLGLRFERAPGGGYISRTSGADVVLPGTPLVLRLPPNAVGTPLVVTEERAGQTWFTIEMPIDGRTAPRPLPRRVQLVWDASGSAASRQLDREFALLDAYFAAVRETSVNLVRVADTVALPERFDVYGGNWHALRAALEATTYDGASNLGAVRHDGVSSEALWFSDGLATYGEPWKLAFPVPVYAINSAASSDTAALQKIADASGGTSIDLGALTRQGAADALLRRGTRLVDVSAFDAKQIVTQSPGASPGRIVVAGMLTAPGADLTLRLRDSTGATTTRIVSVHAGSHPSRLTALQWARLSLASIEGESRTNKVRIRELGRRFALATRETSLIVLEQVDDYVRNEIEPPPELRAEYDRLAATTTRRRGESEAARLAQLVRRFEARIAWWGREFPKDDLVAPLQVAKSEAPRPVGALAAPAEASRRDRGELSRESNDERDKLRSARQALNAPAPSTSNFAAAGNAQALDAAKKSGAGNDEAATTISIALTPAPNASGAIKRLQSARPEEWQRIYFDERRGNEMNVGFFLDAAEFFIAKGRPAFGLRALSNLAEMDLQNRQVLRLLAYRLQQAGQTRLAVPIFERVLELAPNEPQSHRDLGLALADAEQPQAAVDHLYAVATGAWDARFPDIDLIALAEMNAVADKARRDGQPVDVSAVEPRLLKNLALDVRVVLAWDADNTDVDLHVIDPNGEEVFYGHNASRQGGAITRDATGGYGPEEFALRLAKPGKYRIEANFFGHRQQVLTSGTGLMLWLSSGFGTPAQQDRRTTFRVKSERGERVVVGEFEVKPRGAAGG